jgi:hypothetical protein
VDWIELNCLGLNIPALDRLLGALGAATFVYNNILPESNIEPMTFLFFKMPAPSILCFQSFPTLYIRDQIQ